MRSIAKIALGAAFAAWSLVSSAHAPFPSRPVKVTVPYPAGGDVDVVARVVTDRLGTPWYQAVIVEARPGANSNVGTDTIAKATADGHIWFITGPALTANPYPGTNTAWDPK
jgi:tripartite-type tricarboxylate transporter receptor subunit TctC